MANSDLNKRTSAGTLNSFAKDRTGTAEARIVQENSRTERQRYEALLADGYSPDEAYVMATA